jgi:uncharacterized protein (DUF779 family)
MHGRLSITPGAAQVVRSLTRRYGPLMFHISGGCCEGSAPMCFRAGEFRVGSRDELIGEVESCPVFVGAAQHEYWKDSMIEIGVVEGEVESFSLEAPDGVRFTTLSRPVVESSPR